MLSLRKYAAAYVGGKGPKMKALKAGKTALSPEERALVMKSKAVWHHNGEHASPAVWKSMVNGVAWYVTNTHRAYNVTKTLKGTIERFHKFIKGTS